MSLLGVVLAGGRSSRMGRDKAELAWGAQSLIEHQVGLLKSLGCDSVLVAGRNDPRWPSLPDAKPFRGPVEGVANVLGVMAPMFAVAPGKALFIPLDMPLLGKAALERLVREKAPLAAFEGYPLPCAFAVTRGVAEAVAAYNKAPRVSMKGLWDVVPGAAWLQGVPEACLANINTREEYERVKP